MKKILGVHAWLVMVIVALLVVVVAAPVGANGPNNKKLFGEYALNLTANCASCTEMFDTTTLKPFGLGPNLPICPTTTPTVKASSYTWNTEGVFNFDGRGGFEFTGNYLAVLKEPMSIYLPPPSSTDLPIFVGAAPATSMELKCLNGSYTVKDDLTVNLEFGTTEEGCEVTAAEPKLGTIHKIFNMSMKGRLFDKMDGAILFLNNKVDPYDSPNMETVNNFLPPPPSTTYRICGYSGTAMILRGTRGKSK